jgi:hypothetical protein
MTWTYTGDPNVSDRDKVRFLVGDVSSTAEATLTDEEIEYLLESWPDVYEAARAAAEALAARYSGKATTSKSVGDLSLSKDYSSAAQQFRDVADRLASQRNRTAPPEPWIKADAIVRSEKRTTNTGTEFAVGMLDNLRG